MINRILMELYDEYEKGNIDALKDFANKTFPSDGTNKLFVACCVLMFNTTSCFKPRYSCTRENLLSVVLLIKEKIGSSNLMAFYLDRVNEIKGIKKYFKNIIDDEKVDQYADVIIDYLERFEPDFVGYLKYEYEKKIKEYEESLK